MCVSCSGKDNRMSRISHIYSERLSTAPAEDTAHERSSLQRNHSPSTELGTTLCCVQCVCVMCVCVCGCVCVCVCVCVCDVCVCVCCAGESWVVEGSIQHEDRNQFHNPESDKYATLFTIHPQLLYVPYSTIQFIWATRRQCQLHLYFPVSPQCSLPLRILN